MRTMPVSDADSADALAALERFVVDNDELLELEERIGRFNIFDALRIVDREVKHSDFLAWLLDPNESHGQGGLFLRAILMDLFKTARENGFPCPASPIELDGEDLRGVEVRREWRSIDLLVRCRQPDFVIAVENKIKSGEHSDQLSRYRQVVEGEFGKTASMYVFLTVEGDEPSEENWVPYSYGDIHRVLSRVRNANESSIGEDVLAFLDHYLRLLRGRLMDDPKIDELCQMIYKNHRHALQLIFDRVGSPAAGVISHIESLILEDDRWELLNATGRELVIVPTSWSEFLPPIARRKRFAATTWIVIRIEVRRRAAFVGVLVWPTTEPELRRAVIERLTKKSEEFGLTRGREKLTDEWTRLGRRRIATWDEDEGPIAEHLVPLVQKQLDLWHTRLAGVPDALRPIIAEWQQSQALRPS
jgi:hypothetical protein